MLEKLRDLESNATETVRTLLGDIFTAGQIKFLLNRNKTKIHWSSDVPNCSYEDTYKIAKLISVPFEVVLCLARTKVTKD